MLYYRADLYAQHHLPVPQTFDQLLANAKALNAPPRIYGFVQRGDRGHAEYRLGFPAVSVGFGADIFRNQKAGDFTVVLNSPRALAALQFYVTLAHEAGHPNPASVTQADVIQDLVTGRAAQAMITVAAASQMDDPDKSAVVGKIDFAEPPHAAGEKSVPPLGHWLGGIPNNLPARSRRRRWPSSRGSRRARRRWIMRAPVATGAPRRPGSDLAHDRVSAGCRRWPGG